MNYFKCNFLFFSSISYYVTTLHVAKRNGNVRVCIEIEIWELLTVKKLYPRQMSKPDYWAQTSIESLPHAVS